MVFRSPHLPFFLRAPRRTLLPQFTRLTGLALASALALLHEQALAQPSPGPGPDQPQASAPAESPDAAQADEASPLAAPNADAAQAQPSFTVRVDSEDKAVRALIEQHLALRRYAAISDLDDTELQRLMALAEKDARNLLGTMGYFNPTVRVATSAPVAQRPEVTVHVQPGPQTRIADVQIDFAGDIASSTDAAALAQKGEIESGWSLQAGEAFSQSAWSSAKTDALRTLVAKRYPKGQLAHSLADVDAPENAAHLKLRLDSGPLYRLGPVTVKGHERHDPVLAERLSWLQTGEPYDQKRLVDAQQRLAASGYYSSAYIAIDPDGAPEAVPITIQVREAKLQRINLGVGYSTDAGPRLTLEHRHNKLPGIGWRAITKIQANRKTPLLETEWMSVPAASGWRNAALARLDRIDDRSLITTSTRLRLGRVKSEERYDRNIYIQYDRSSAKLSGDAAANSPIYADRLGDALMGDGAAISLNYAWTGRYFDHMTAPRAGHGLAFEVGGGTTLLNGNQPFVRALGRWVGFVPLAGSRLQFRAEGGAVIANQKAAIPASYLFRTGGDTTVRGYGYRRIGIPYEGEVTLPGRYLAVGSVEWLRPLLPERFGGLLEHALFVDVGGVGQRASDISRNVGVGTGLRMNTPVGPLALDLAYGLKTKAVRLHMSVGFVF